MQIGTKMDKDVGDTIICLTIAKVGKSYHSPSYSV